MLAALRLVLLTLAVLLCSSSAAQSAKGLSVAVPAEGQVAVAVASGAKSVKVKSAPAGVTVAGGVKQGRLAVAVVRPRGVGVSGKVVFTLSGKAKGMKTFAAALDGGKAGAACPSLASLLAKKLKGSADVKALAGVLEAKLCGKPAPAGAPDVLAKLGLGPAKPGLGASGPSPGSGGTLTRPGGSNDYECKVYDPFGSASLKDGERDGVDMTLQLKGPVDCAKKATIALYELSGQATELQALVGNCKTLPAPPPKCNNGKDDDGDGMIDSRDAAGTTDPDPGCSGVADTSENSELPVPAHCVQDGLFGGNGGNPLTPGVFAEGCGAITGVWDKPPGTPDECGYWFGDDDLQPCTVKAGTVGATFAPTNIGVSLAAHLTANATCRLVTIALVLENGSVMARRKNFCED